MINTLKDMLEHFANTNLELDINEILEMQKVLQEAMGEPTGRGELGVKENMLALIVEATEVLDEVSWKPWKPPCYKTVDRTRFVMEMTDILQFWANAANGMDVTMDEITECLRAKWAINILRMENGEVTLKK